MQVSEPLDRFKLVLSQSVILISAMVRISSTVERTLVRRNVTLEYLLKPLIYIMELKYLGVILNLTWTFRGEHTLEFMAASLSEEKAFDILFIAQMLFYISSKRII